MLEDIKPLKALSEAFQGGSTQTTEDFVYLQELGQGSFGKVYKVSSKYDKSIYAMKVLSKNQLIKLKLITQLKNEVSLLALCDHPNIIKLYTAFEDDNYIYLIMELASEGNLFQKLKREKRFTEKLTKQYMTDIITAIEYLHSFDPAIMHRDLKPENVLVSNNNKLKLADFGWSMVDDDFRNTYCGTPDYLAPEMIKGTGHTKKLDIWTVGVLMYELLHGCPPFSPKIKTKMNRRGLQNMIEENILNGVIEFDKNVSREARETIKILMNINPEARPKAQDILQLPFFNKKSKKEGVNNILNDKSTFICKTTKDQLLINKLEKDKQVLQSENKQLQKSLENQTSLVWKLGNDNNKLKDEILLKEKQINRLIEENQSLNKINTIMNKENSMIKENEELCTEVNWLHDCLNRLSNKEEDIKKQITDFYKHHYYSKVSSKANETNSNDYQEILKKIFNSYLLLKDENKKLNINSTIKCKRNPSSRETSSSYRVRRQVLISPSLNKMKKENEVFSYNRSTAKSNVESDQKIKINSYLSRPTQFK